MSPAPPDGAPTSVEDRRVQRLQRLDDHIGRALRESEARGELRSAPSDGKPLRPDEGFDETPAALRLPFKILKNAGVLAPEVQLMREIASLQRALEGAGDDQRRALQQQITDKRQHLALRLDKLRLSGSL